MRLRLFKCLWLNFSSFVSSEKKKVNNNNCQMILSPFVPVFEL